MNRDKQPIAHRGANNDLEPEAKWGPFIVLAILVLVEIVGMALFFYRLEHPGQI